MKDFDASSLKVRLCCIAQLKRSPRNARAHPKKQLQQIAASIQRFGFLVPILVDTENRVIAGHGRLEAATMLGLELIPTLCINHLTDDERRAYTLADNKIAENAAWDTDLLRIELEYLSQVHIDVDVDLTGFSAPEIDILLGADNKDTPEEPPPPLPPTGRTVTRPGDLYALGPHRLICGDCRSVDVLDNLMERAQAQMVITDPPYNLPIDGVVRGHGKHRHPEFVMASGEMSGDTFTTFLSDSFTQLARVSRVGSIHYAFMDWRHLPELLTAAQMVYDSMLNLCVWAKPNAGMGSLYRSQHELILVCKHGRSAHINNIELGKHGRYRTNVWSYPGVNAFGPDREEALAMHPTVKPVSLIADAILDTTRRGGIVLDGFLGSGTTILAAEQTGRIGYGVELDPRYVDVSIRRWMRQHENSVIHVDTGMSFDELATTRIGDQSMEGNDA